MSVFAYKLLKIIYRLHCMKNMNFQHLFILFFYHKIHRLAGLISYNKLPNIGQNSP